MTVPESGGNRDDELIERALEGLDLAPLARDPAGQYEPIPEAAIEEAAGHNPLKSDFMRHGNEMLGRAQAQALGDSDREPIEHEAGWSIAIETPQGYVGLWSCWLKNRFYLGYPKDYHGIASDELIMDTLDVERAEPVEVDRGYNVDGKRLWTKFYGPHLEEGGRVWVDTAEHESSGVHFSVLGGSGRLETISYGGTAASHISTYPASFFSDTAPDGPNSQPDAVQPYKEKFVRLAGEIARLLGGAENLHIEYGFVLVPEQLEREGYEVKWHKGTPRVRKGMGHELVSGAKDGEVVMLKSGNSLVPWSATRRLEIPDELSAPEKLTHFILNDALIF